jgi:uncharacterized protein YoxC
VLRAALFHHLRLDPMNDRNGDNLDGLPSMAPSRDDIETRRSSRRGDSAPARTAPATTGLVMNLVLAGLIAGLTACGWFLVTLDESLDQARSERAAAEDRLARIEDRLSMTDQALDETESETQSQIDFWESEIRKLWDVTNKRNRDWIEENQKAVAGLRSKLDSQSQTLSEVRAQATDLQRSLGTQEEILEQLTVVDRHTSELRSQQRELTDTVNTLEQGVNGMEGQVRENAEAVEAIDAFRRDVVGRLTRMQERIDALSRTEAPARTLTPES